MSSVFNYTFDESNSPRKSILQKQFSSFVVTRYTKFLCDIWGLRFYDNSVRLLRVSLLFG